MIAPGGITSFWIPSSQFRNANVQTVLDKFPNPLAPDEPGKIAQVINLATELGVYDEFRYLIGLFLTDPLNARTSWFGTFTATAVSSPSHTPKQGFLLNGTTQYINTNFIPSTGGLLQNSTHVEAYIYDNLSVGVNDYLFGVADTIGDTWLNQNAALRSKVNATTTAVYVGDTVFADLTRYGVGRVNSANAETFTNGVEVQTDAKTSTAVTTKPFFVGALNNNDTPFGHLNSTIGHFEALVNPNLTNLKTVLDLMESLLIV